jgi:hypothetical protein
MLMVAILMSCSSGSQNTGAGPRTPTSGSTTSAVTDRLTKTVDPQRSSAGAGSAAERCRSAQLSASRGLDMRYYYFAQSLMGSPTGTDTRATSRWQNVLDQMQGDAVVTAAPTHPRR